MKTHHLVIAAVLAALLVALVAGAYTWNFGLSWPESHEKWGQFGDYVGGTLNPLLALLAFLALLWSLALQALALRQASDQFVEQGRLAREESEATRRDKVSRELLEVIKDIDERIQKILATSISPSSHAPSLAISHMASEAERLANSEEESAAYASFLEQAGIKGTLVEASTRELLYLIEKMRKFIGDYSDARQGTYAPIIEYYADKVFHLLHLAHDLGGAKGDFFEFFATVADPPS
jgi:hypothetical protein